MNCWHYFFLSVRRVSSAREWQRVKTWNSITIRNPQRSRINIVRFFNWNPTKWENAGWNRTLKFNIVLKPKRAQWIHSHWCTRRALIVCCCCCCCSVRFIEVKSSRSVSSRKPYFHPTTDAMRAPPPPSTAWIHTVCCSFFTIIIPLFVLTGSFGFLLLWHL